MKPVIPFLAIVLPFAAGAAEKLLPFQGYLANASGTAIDGEAKVVQFRIWRKILSSKRFGSEQATYS